MVRKEDPSYPPPIDVAPDPNSLKDWLFAENGISRWVAIQGSRVIGHVQLIEPNDYLLENLPTVADRDKPCDRYGEIAKLFVDPRSQMAGVGRQLLMTCCRYSWHLNRQPALAVVTSSTSAVNLYMRSGMRQVGHFAGRHGENLVFIQDRLSGSDGT